ncbi:MAG: DUF4982 domain-containing protein [Prevotella sp.]|jgi:beta-galactosidase|nr:DUF4982 domain-containing protein [Prevotella sp.]
MRKKFVFILILFCSVSFSFGQNREKIDINDGWRFFRYENNPDSLIYDERPTVFDKNDVKDADTRATLQNHGNTSNKSLKMYILPTANEFIKDKNKHYERPDGNPGKDFAFVKNDFNDSNWQYIDLPHDWAIDKPFYTEENAIVGGGMGRLPVQGVAWYRRKINIPKSDSGKEIYLDIDGAMSYAMVWLNGNLVGGWPYGYNSFRLNLTPFVNFEGDNQLAIRLDNPTNSSRWYPGAGIYRNVWLVKTSPVHVAHWGTFIKTENISEKSATITISIDIDNNSTKNQDVEILTDIYRLDNNLKISGNKVVTFPKQNIVIEAREKSKIRNTVNIKNPLLWGVYPQQEQNMYLAVNRLFINNKLIDTYETRFGIRDIKFDAKEGLLINGEKIRIQGVNQHHDLGALGAAFNLRAAERQLEILRELGCNAIRLAHNPPAPELLELTDRMGFLVIDEIFDCWEKGKNPLDFHLIFPDWYEADIRAFIRRDKNHPSIIAWSFGNEVGEQYTDESGAAVAWKLAALVKDEDSTRPTTASMNFAKPDMPFPQTMDIISLNYQGEGIRDAAAYSHLKGIRTPPLYPAFHQKFPDKMIVSSETASALSSRGTYFFPVFAGNSAPVSEGSGGNDTLRQVSAYELYTSPFGSSADKVFAMQDNHPFVAGEFVWTGWDHLGEPTPYYSSRSSYCGIIDLAGFKKDRFYLYQSRWRPELPTVHILPHWNWESRTGQITPVHIFTSGDEAELFLNGKSLGKKKKDKFEYRLRWDSVVYEPGILKAVAYKDGKQWAIHEVKTTGIPVKIALSADRNVIDADGKDISFITVRILDSDGNLVPNADNKIWFEISGTGEIVATDNGNPADMISFASKERSAFGGLALVIIRGKKGKEGEMELTARSERLDSGSVIISSR